MNTENKFLYISNGNFRDKLLKNDFKKYLKNNELKNHLHKYCHALNPDRYHHHHRLLQPNSFTFKKVKMNCVTVTLRRIIVVVVIVPLSQLSFLQQDLANLHYHRLPYLLLTKQHTNTASFLHITLCHFDQYAIDQQRRTSSHVIANSNPAQPSHDHDR